MRARCIGTAVQALAILAAATVGAAAQEADVVHLEKACNLNSSAACNNLGVLWSEGRGGAAKVDHVKAAVYYKKACSLSNGLGCFNYGNIYRLGEGVPVDLQVAFASFKQSCDLDQAKGCTELAVMYYEGKPVAKNVALKRDDLRFVYTLSLRSS